MAMMTPAEKERSQRICEALGTAACALLTWPVVWLALSVRSMSTYLDPEQKSPSGLIPGVLVFLSYFSVFALLDRWRRNYYTGPLGEMRLNWLLIPFAGTFFSFLSGYFFTPQARAMPSNVHWFSETLVATLAYGALMVCVMVCFWVLGVIVRFARG